MGKIISICSEKGGAGKTTTAIGVARGLHKMGFKVLLVDLDSQANASRTLKFVKDGRPTSAELIYNTIAGNAVDFSDYVREDEDGLYYIPSSNMLTGIVTFMANDSDSNYIIKRAFNGKVSGFDFVIFDCRTLLDLLVSNALNASNAVIIPVESGVYSFDGLSKMLEKVQSINNTTNKELTVLGLLLNKLNGTIVGTSIADSVREAYGDLVFNTSIPYCPAQAEKNIIGMASKNKSMTNAFDALAVEVLERISG